MKVIINNIIPFKGFLAINIFGILFVRLSTYEKMLERHKYDKYWEEVLNHERIHTAQMKELLYIFFYLWYFLEWLIKVFYYFNFKKAYKNIGFEREANKYEKYFEYLDVRKHYSWIKCIF